MLSKLWKSSRPRNARRRAFDFARDRSGVAAVEFAFVVPVLVTLAKTFTGGQLAAIERALDDGTPGKKAVDVRFSIPLAGLQFPADAIEIGLRARSRTIAAIVCSPTKKRAICSKRR